MPAHGGVLRLWVPFGLPAAPGGWDACEPGSAWLLRTLGVGLVRSDTEPAPALAAGWSREALPGQGGGEVWTFALDPEARFPDGVPLNAAVVVASWERALRDPCSTARWLLGTVRGVDAFVDGAAEHVAGLVATDGQLSIAVGEATPDLPRRLAHPDLAVLRLVDGVPAGTAPFRIAEVADGRVRLERHPYSRNGAPRLDAVELSGGRDDPALLLRLGELDAALVYGRAADELVQDEDWLGATATGWTRTYVLWVHGRAWPTRDERFRSWLARAIDREALARYTFGGRAAVAKTLEPVADPPSQPAAATRPPGLVAERLTLLYDEADPAAAAIAARLRAELLRRTRVELRGASGGEFAQRLAAGSESLALIAHTRATSDAELDLGGTLSKLGPPAGDALAQLELACRRSERREGCALAARAIEGELIGSGRLIPLVRLDGWLVARPGLAGLAGGTGARLTLQEVGWTR